MGVAVIAAAGAVAGVASSIAAARDAGVGTREQLANLATAARTSVMSEQRSREEWIALWERRYGSRPGNIVDAMVTPYPRATPGFLQTAFPGDYPGKAGREYPNGPRFQLAGLCEVIATKARGGILAAEVLATLASVEGGRDGGGALRRFNVGNFKWSRGRDAGRPAFFLVDRIPSPGFYPAFDSWDDGVTYWLDRLFGQRNFRGALERAAEGDLRGFTEVLGAGGYAQSYRDRNALVPRYVDRVRAGALPGALIRQGKLPGYRINGARLEVVR